MTGRRESPLAARIAVMVACFAIYIIENIEKIIIQLQYVMKNEKTINSCN
jgi:hypothetical protein